MKKHEKKKPTYNLCLGREWLSKTVRYEDCNFAEGDDILYHSSKNFAKTIHEGVAGKRKKMVLTQDQMLFMLMN